MKYLKETSQILTNTNTFDIQMYGISTRHGYNEIHKLYPCLVDMEDENKFIWLMLCTDTTVVNLLGSFVSNSWSDLNICKV